MDKRLILPQGLAESLEEKVSPELLVFRSGAHLPYRSFFGNFLFNFRDADIGNIAEFGINEKEVELLRMAAVEKSCELSYVHSLEDVARRILSEETDFDLSSYDIHTSVNGAARGAIPTALLSFVNEKRPFVSYSSPNWSVFDSIVKNVGARSNTFFATTGDEFVEGFLGLPYKDKTAALIIVDPANPLGYKLDKGHVERIEDTAQKYGIAVIFDDVFRGLQEKGKRHSASEHSKNSIVIETTSKRFSSRALGATWSLVPKSFGFSPQEQVVCKGCYSKAAMMTEGLYEANFDSKIGDALALRTQAFMQGMADSIGPDKGKFMIGFLGMPLFCYLFPKIAPGKRMQLIEDLNVFGATTGNTWICDYNAKKISGTLKTEELVLAFSYMRICPTKESIDRCYIGGKLIGNLIKDAAS